MTDLSDAELDERIRAAGLLLDAAAQRAAAASGGRRRPRSHRPLVLAAAVLVVVAIGATALVALRGDEPADVRIDTTTTSEPADPIQAILDLRADGVIVTGDALFDLTTGEATQILAAGDGNGSQGSPTAVDDGAGGIYYLSRDPDGDPQDPDDFGRAELRHLTTDGTDEVVRAAVTSFALREDGALAMAVRTEPIIRNNGPWTSTIVVIGPDGTEVTWSPQPAEYEVTAWAGERLLGERRKEDTEAMDVVVFDRPGEVRDLGEQAFVHAVDRDLGAWVVLSRLRPGEQAHDGDEPPRLPEVVDVATGFSVGTVTADADLTVDAGALGVGPMRWVGEDVLVGPAGVTGSQASLVAEMEVEDRSGAVTIRITRVVAIDPRGFTPDEVWQARDGTIYALGATSDQRYDPLLHVCRRGEDTCEAHDLPFEQGPVTYLDGSAWR